jgi:type III pantothenate kinase
VILELDIGNTRAKWRRLAGDGARVDGGAVEVDAIREAIPWQEASVAAVRIASVAGDRFEAELSEFIQRRIDVVPRFARAGTQAGRIRSGYHVATQLGVDRWLSMLAAGQMTGEAFAVLDGGSAITLDLVAGSGDHLGGYIAPGLAAMRESLRQGTARVRPGASVERIPAAPGRSTREAVNAGIVRMVGDFAVTEFSRFESAQSDRAVLFVTGGDGEILAGLCDEAGIDARLVPELVLDGLAVACP